MKSVIIRNYSSLRRHGYQFLENSTSDKMKIYDGSKNLLYFIKVKENGHLKVKDVQKKSVFNCEQIEIFLNPIDNGIGILSST